ncbi:toxin-antitoxin system, antitoxin component [Candidatus Magnetoovum chiemensis]|nr:toxin-antitoxin system, antitoxin component [Candidatus Magnetoovum chiemensis]
MSTLESKLTKAWEALDNAEQLKEAGFDKEFIVNNLYYAMFYTITALLGDRKCSEDLKHTDIIAMFNDQYIQPAIMDENLLRTVLLLREGRKTCSCTNPKEIKDDQLNNIFPLVRNFIEKTQTIILSENFTRK